MTHDGAKLAPTDAKRPNQDSEVSLLLPYTDSISTNSQDSFLLWRVLLAVTFFITAIAMTVPVRPLLILQAASNDLSLASYFTGLVDSSQAVLSILSAPMLGAVSDVVGRKPILLLSHLGELIALLVVAQFPRSLVAQFPAYLLIALTSAYSTTVNTMIADIATKQGNTLQAVKSYGYLGSTYGLCFLIGPVLGGAIEDSFYIASSFHIAAVLIVIAMAYVLFTLPETKPQDNDEEILRSLESSEHTAWQQFKSMTSRVITATRETEINPIPRIRRIFSQSEALTWIAFAVSISSLAQNGLNSIIFLYVNERLGWGPKETGIFLSMVGLSLLVSQGILSPIAVHYLGEMQTILVGYAIASLHYLIYAFASRAEIMFLGLFVGTFSFISEPALKSLLARQVHPNSQGSLQGSLSALSTVVRPISPLISATTFSIGNSIGIIGLPFYVIGTISFIAFIVIRIASWKEGLK